MYSIMYILCIRINSCVMNTIIACCLLILVDILAKCMYNTVDQDVFAGKIIISAVKCTRLIFAAGLTLGIGRYIRTCYAYNISRV